MLDKDVKIGMKVVPFQKTVKYWGDLSASAVWNRARRNNQSYLFIIEYSRSDSAWVLSERQYDVSGDFFNACDFDEYVLLPVSTDAIIEFFNEVEKHAVMRGHASLFLKARAQTEILRKQAVKAQEYEEYYSDVISENCANDEMHCTCVPALRAEIEKIKTAYSKFAVNVMTTAIMGIADGAIVSNKDLDETDALKAVQQLSEACVSYRRENERITNELFRVSANLNSELDKALAENAKLREFLPTSILRKK